jgi:hypothetical protein
MENLTLFWYNLRGDDKKMIYNLELDTTSIKIQPKNELEEIFQNVRMALSTLKGSVPLDRGFGISTSMLDAPMNNQSRLVAEVAQAIQDCEPRARLRSINFSGNSNGELTPVLSLEIRKLRDSR